ncbi:MAG: ABC transporter substrate-binding protein [Capsulimonadaceae bacterium]
MSSPQFRRGQSVVASILLLILLGGCSNNPYPPGQTAKSVIYRTLPEAPRDLDPTKSYSEIEAYIIDNIYADYFKYDFLKRNPYRLDLNLGAEEPVVAPYPYTVRERGRIVNKVGQSWTFRIKHGLRFQDDPCFPGGKGREITAADFLYSFRRMANPDAAIACPIVNFVSDKILGYADYMQYCADRFSRKLPMDYACPVEGLQLDPKDPYTFRILLNQPYPQLRFLMAMHFTTPLAHEAIEKYGNLQTHPVGNSTYILASMEPHLRWVLKVNPNRPLEYYPTEGSPADIKAGLLQDAGKQLPLNNEIDIDCIRELVTDWNLFAQGYEDINSVTNTNFTTVATLQGTISPAMARKGMRLQKAYAADTRYFFFNMKDPVVGGYSPEKCKLRQAISCAMDSQGFIDLVNNGIGVRANYVVPPGIFGYDPSYQNPWAYNIPKAKKLLAEAGYPGGIDPKTGEQLTIYYDTGVFGASDRQIVEWTVKQFAAIGIKLVPRYWRDIVLQSKMDSGDYQFTWLGWIADYPDPENFMMLLYGPNLRPGPNYCGYENPEYDRLFERMRSLNDGPERLALIQQLRSIQEKDCPMVYVAHDVNLGLYQGWLHNTNPLPVEYDLAKYDRVDGPFRARMQAEWNRPNYWPILILVALIVLGSIPAARVVDSRKYRRIRRSQGSIH